MNNLSTAFRPISVDLPFEQILLGMELHSKEGIIFSLEGGEEILTKGSSGVGLHIPKLAEELIVEEVLLGDCEMVVEVKDSIT